MSPKKTVVKVTIGGDEYTLKSDRAAEYTRACAAHVDRALGDAQSTGTVVEAQKAAILAALAITDELFEARRGQHEMAARLNALATELARLLPPNKRSARGSATFASSAEGA